MEEKKQKEEQIQRKSWRVGGKVPLLPVSSAFLSKAFLPSDFTPPSLPWDSPQRSL